MPTLSLTLTFSFGKRIWIRRGVGYCNRYRVCGAYVEFWFGAVQGSGVRSELWFHAQLYRADKCLLCWLLLLARLPGSRAVRAAASLL